MDIIVLHYDNYHGNSIVALAIHENDQVYS